MAMCSRNTSGNGSQKDRWFWFHCYGNSKEAGLIHDEAEGPRRHYSVNQRLLERLKALIAAI
jgi:hypothetical protein